MSPTPTTGVGVLEDPLAGLAEVSSAGMTNFNRINSGGTYSPGYYPRGIQLSNGTATLQPGVYYIGSSQQNNRGLRMTGNSSLQGTGVLLFLAGNQSAQIGGRAQLNLSPPLDGEYAGLCIFQARGNAVEFSVSGRSATTISGGIYTPAAHVAIGGTSTGSTGRIIAKTLEVDQNSVWTVDPIFVQGQASTLIVR